MKRTTAAITKRCSDVKNRSHHYMPIKKTSQCRESAGKPGHPNSHQRILVVDDNEDIRRLNTEVLAESGYQVDTAADGARAWDSLQIKNYDLLLTDYGLPRVNGLSLIKKLRAARITIPVILVSGTVSAEDLKHPRLHIDATLCKPYTLSELLASVRKALEPAHHLPASPRQRIHKNSSPLDVSKHLSKRKPARK